LKDNLSTILKVTSARDAFAKKVLGVLVFLRSISEDRSQMIIDNMDEWSILLLVVVFFLTPGFITRFGLLLITLLYPAAISIRSLQSPTTSLRWLKYWVVYALSHMLLLLLDPLLGE